MTIKTTHLSIKKYQNINGISAPGIYITFPSFFKKVTHIEAKTLIGYTFENNVLKLTIETDNTKQNVAKVNRNNSIFISKDKCPELSLLNINTKSIRVKFIVRNNELMLNLSSFKSQVVNLHEAKSKKELMEPSFQYYNEENAKKVG